MTTSGSEPTATSAREAARRIAGLVHRTPLLTSRQLDERSGATVVVKCEHLQKIGAFKARGATNAVRSLDPEVRLQHGRDVAWRALNRRDHTVAEIVRLQEVRGRGRQMR